MSFLTTANELDDDDDHWMATTYCLLFLCICRGSLHHATIQKLRLRVTIVL